MGLFTREYNFNIPRQYDSRRAMAETLARYDSRLEQYEKALSSYRQQLADYESQLKKYEQTDEDQMAAVQAALDLTYIKEELGGMRKYQEDTLSGQAKDLALKQDDIFRKVVRLDQELGERLENLFKEQECRLEEMEVRQEQLERKSHKGLKQALGVLIFFTAAGLGGIAFIIMYLLQIIAL